MPKAKNHLCLHGCQAGLAEELARSIVEHGLVSLRMARPDSPPQQPEEAAKRGGVIKHLGQHLVNATNSKHANLEWHVHFTSRISMIGRFFSSWSL